MGSESWLSRLFRRDVPPSAECFGYTELCCAVALGSFMLVLPEWVLFCSKTCLCLLCNELLGKAETRIGMKLLLNVLSSQATSVVKSVRRMFGSEAVTSK